MMKHASPAPSRRGMLEPVKLPWPLMLLLALNVIPELIFQLTDHGIIGPPWLRPLAYAFGAFQHDLVKNGTFFLGQPLTMFFTYGLLHTGIAHLTINMIGLVWLGRLGLEYRTSETFLTFYLIATIGAAEMFALIGPDGGSMVGASGALFGLMGLYLVDSGLLAPRMSAWHSLIARIALATVLLIVSDIFSSFLLGSSIAWEAHAGGFLTGAALALIFPPRKDQRR